MSRPTPERLSRGTELIRLRKSAGFSQTHAARLLGWSQSKVSRIERGMVETTAADIAALTYLYNRPGRRYLDTQPRPASFREEAAQYIMQGAVRTAFERWMHDEFLVAHPIGDNEGMPAFMVVLAEELTVPAPPREFVEEVLQVLDE